MSYVVIHGRTPSHLREQNADSAKVALYVSGISYGTPSVRAVTIGEHFAAIAEFDHASQARTTFQRMGSFNFGASFIEDREIALREFGTWAYHYAPPRRDPNPA